MRKIAFLVGNDTFPKDPSIPPLRFTQNDARELAAVLEDPETCGFETRVYLNRSSQEVLTDLDQVSGELGQEDTLLFYYSGHGKLRGSELCLVSNETATTSLGATSIRTRLVLSYLQESLARRRILILDCCHSGAIASIYKTVDSKSALDGLANSFGSYILTASTTIQLAEEREKDGHGVYTKALIDCLREGPKEQITINDLHEYASSRLKVSAQQTPLFWALQQEGTAVEIGNYRAKHERERREAIGQLVATARIKFDGLKATGVFTQGQVDSILDLLARDEATLLPNDQDSRNKAIRYLKGEIGFFSAFGTVPQIAEHPPPREPEPPEPEGAAAPPAPPIAASSKEPIVSNDTPNVREDETERVLKLDSTAADAECRRLMERILNKDECWVVEIDPENRFIIKFDASAATPCIMARAVLGDNMSHEKQGALSALGWTVVNHTVIKVAAAMAGSALAYLTFGLPAVALLDPRVRNFFFNFEANRSWIVTGPKDALIDAAAADLTLALRTVALETKTIIVRRQEAETQE